MFLKNKVAADLNWKKAIWKEVFTGIVTGITFSINKVSLLTSMYESSSAFNY